ncbi:UNVERIFIED_CONTAM: hypothetical protein Sradi_3865900 [Sesamum radiatum]|uniref:Uncharacterized protein n=1 Tax=Sesamum radiatum TaxID=300843 RepID=A0AAW2Q214_SESRA
MAVSETGASGAPTILETELDRPPKKMEETFQKLMDDHQPQSTADMAIPPQNQTNNRCGWLQSGARTRILYSALVLRLTSPSGHTHHHRHTTNTTTATTTSKPGYGGPYRPPRGDDGRHDGYDAGRCGLAPPLLDRHSDRLQYRPNIVYD